MSTPPLTPATEDRTVFFSGVPKMKPHYLVKQYFKQCFGEIESLSLKYGSQTIKNDPYLLHSGSGKLIFQNSYSARLAKSQHYHLMDGVVLVVKQSTTNKELKAEHLNMLDENRKVYVHSLPRSITLSSLKAAFERIEAPSIE